MDKSRVERVSIPRRRAGHSISFAASPSDAWSPIHSTDWTFGDGSAATGSSVTHSFQEAGRFPVTVTTTDAAGHSSTASGRSLSPRHLQRHAEFQGEPRQGSSQAPLPWDRDLSWQRRTSWQTPARKAEALRLIAEPHLRSPETK